MLPTLLAAVLSAADPGAPLLLTSGWQAVLDVPEVRAVVIDDPRVVSASDVRDGTVTLLGLVPGETRLWAYTGRPDAPRVLLYPVVVTRFPTLLPFERILPLEVEERRSAKLAGASRIVAADPSVCRVVLGPDGVELVGRRAGTTTLIAWVEGRPRYLLLGVRGGAIIPTADELDEELTEPADGRLVLRVGERGIVDAPSGLWRVAMKDSTVASVVPRAGELVFEGLHVGATRVLTWNAGGKPGSRYVVVLPRALGDQDPVPPPDPTLPEPVPLPADSAL